VRRVETLGFAKSGLWVKEDNLTNDTYGGNKVRKLDRILVEARERGTRRIITVGAVGSHHVLATAYFGRRAGLEVEAVLLPQPGNDHVVPVLRAALGLGLRALPARSWSVAAALVARRVAGGARFVPVGGSSVLGSLAYVDAARELVAQIRRGELPEPEVCVVALGSGGTAAGLAAGFAAEGVRTRVVGVCISQPTWLLRSASRGLARACARRTECRMPEGSGLERTECRMPEGARRAGPQGRLERISSAAVRSRLHVDARFLGAGYAHPTDDGAAAIELARDHAALALDPTYTAKAFACALWYLRARRAAHVLYWHTLSSAPMEPLLDAAPREGAVDPRLRALIVPP
jgi:1-aminocyclopropane-1-carboxylate deaminase/D-cysteine desulfhydrase-like pyridoxal-dependent ACC family enzyme